nr:TMV resistance protein N [Tanacetum cinerariifolium]
RFFSIRDCMEDLGRVWSSSQNSDVKLVEDDVSSLRKEGGSSAASKHVNFDAGYDSSFEDGSSKEPNVARGRRKKKSKKDSELGELEETIKNAIANIVVRENQCLTMEECHEKLKSMSIGFDTRRKKFIHEVLDQMLVFAKEVIRPTTFNPNPNIPGNNRRERPMFKGVVSVLDKTLIHVFVPSQNVYRGRGTAHDARILNEALKNPIYEFPIPPSGI